MEIFERLKSESLTDEEVVNRVRDGETALYEVIMRRYNQRLYRIARAILHNDVEAEDVMQDAYVRAYTHLGQFAARAPFASWLTRIAVNEALPAGAQARSIRRWTPQNLTENYPCRIATSLPTRNRTPPQHN
jgi:RNA polymerase sigma-70 factor, ECF subfamily